MTSQRSILSCSQTSRSQSGKNPMTEFFKTIVKDAGIKLSSNEDPNVITQEQALVVRDIDKLLEENSSDDCVEKFLKGFKLLIKKERYMRKALLPTLFKKTSVGENGAQNDSVQIQQESLFRIFLKVNRLQKDIIDILLDEITASVSEADDHDTALLRLFLSQLRYLPHISIPDRLTTRLLDVLDISPFPCQLEILDSLPEILPDSEYTETAKQLSKLLDGEEELASAVIDCLNALDLDVEIRAQVQDHVLAKMLIEPSMKQFPIFLEFLMTDYKSQHLSTNLFKIRTALDTLMGSDHRNDKEKETGKILIFNRFQTLAGTTKIISEAWLNVISRIKVHTDHKPIDLLVLFMLHEKFKKRTVELTFRKRVKDGLFKCTLLEKLFDKYLPQQLLRDHFRAMVETGCALLRSSDDVSIVEFASSLFRALFKHEHTETIYQQEMLDSLILLAGSSDRKNVTAILNIFHSLLDDGLRHHTVLLMRLLEKLDAFELKDVKLVFEILCTLTCSDESLSGLKEEIHMIVRKQLGSSKRSIKHRGIISAVVMAKHVATTNEDQSEVQVSDDSVLSLNHLKGRAKEAAAVLELAKTSTSGNPELLGLYYDRLAAVLLESDNLDKNFSAWLYETVTNDFQNVFVTETVCDDIDDLQFSMQYNINEEEEMEAPLAVNIAELTLKGEKSSIAILAPHFRLLRLLHYRQQNGDLSSIDALLGCGVVLPKHEQRSSLDTEQMKRLTDCLFHCINWFREVIGGFVTQKSKKLRQKVVRRVADVIELESLLEECMESVPGHILPSSYFDVVSQVAHAKIASPQKETTGRAKKLKSRSIVNDTTVPSTSAAKKKPGLRKEEQIRFREIDTDIIRLIKYPLNSIDPTSPTSDQTTLTIHQLNFILKDFADKLSLVTKKRDLGLSHLNVVEPSALISDCRVIFPNLRKHFTAIVKTLDGDLVDEEFQTAFGLVLEILWLVFSWSGFQHSTRLDLLRDVLKAFRPPEETQNLYSVNRLIVDLVGGLSGEVVDRCTGLTHGVFLIKIMEALYSITPGSEIRKEIAKTSEKLLGRTWSGSNAADVEILIKAYLSGADIKTLCGLVGTLQEQAVALKTKGDNLEMLRSVNKSNFYILYRNLWTCLHDRIKTDIQSLTNNQHLTLWRTAALTMQGLMSVAKIQENKSNLVTFLKKSVGILKIFLSHGIPIMEIMLRSKPDKVVEIFKTIQSNTRFLHHLCCYSKLVKHAGLMAHVPQFRLILETFIYRVKAALVANGCSDAFWMGNLRNRDLQGEDILTQSTENTTTEEGNEEEEILPSEEEDEDLDDEEEEEGRRRKSGSAVYD